MNLTSNYYDKEYFEGGKGYYSYNDNGTFDDMADNIIKLFNPRSTLEIGCAKGFAVKALRKKGVNAFGIDISEYAISQAPEEAFDYLFLHDVTKTTSMIFPKVDLIYSFDTFEHIPEDKLDRVWTFMNNFGRDYYIKVGTLNTPDWGHDDSHITMHTLEWWARKFPKVTWEESL